MVAPFLNRDNPEQIRKRLLLHVRVRWAVLTALIGIGTGYQLSGGDIEINRGTPLDIIILIVSVNIIIWAAVRYIHSASILRIMTLLQITFDLAVFSVATYITDGPASPAVILYCIPIVISSALLDAAAVYFTAITSTAFYALVLWLTQIASGRSDWPYTYTSQIIFFGLVFVIMAYVAEFLGNLRRNEEGERVQLEMVSLATHQLRTPATAVKGFLSLLQDGDMGKLNADQRDFIHRAYEENEMELRLIGNMLDVAHLDLQQLNFHPEQVDLRAMIVSLAEEHKLTSTKRKQTLILNIPESPVIYRCDEQLLRMAMDNLVSNAVKYGTPTGNVKIGLRELTHKIVITIEDNGIGIARGDQRKLFKRFSRVGSDSSSQVEGAGLGLYLVKKIMSIHDSKIDVVSYPGEGSIFTIELPKRKP
ncbi:MAG TPA: HAMP domain-containing sensor histidine kinase [Candidatus Saccharimonadales bacterium]|nr:HAMP domain-containing sensor histidine kinase [Candidatus Saccharimonadales bacterium]